MASNSGSSLNTKAIRLGSMATISASVAVTVTYPAGTDYLLVQPYQHDLKVTFDGTAPAIDRGFTIPKDVATAVYVPEEATLKMIALSDDPVICIQAFRTLHDRDT